MKDDKSSTPKTRVVPKLRMKNAMAIKVILTKTQVMVTMR